MPEEFVVSIAPVVPELRLRITQDAFGEYTAQVIGLGCVGDGSSRDEAIASAVSLYLHAVIRRIHLGQWRPQVRRSY